MKKSHFDIEHFVTKAVNRALKKIKGAGINETIQLHADVIQLVFDVCTANLRVELSPMTPDYSKKNRASFPIQMNVTLPFSSVQLFKKVDELVGLYVQDNAQKPVSFNR